MAYALVYRLEFKNFEENVIRVDIYDSSVNFVPGSSISPASTAFYVLTGNNHIGLPGVDLSFFYVGQTIAITGTASNNGTFTVTFVNVPFGEIFVAETVVTEGSTTAVITDTSSTDPQVISLQGTGTPLVISTINNDQDKFQPIRSKQAVIQFVSDSAIPADITNFSAGPDNKWKVDVSIIGIVPYVFRGFLIMSDNQQPFQPDPQTVQLTATDHLGVLKDIALIDYNGDNPKGVYRIADLVMMCLRQTGMYLDLYVVNNLRAGSGQLVINTTFISASNRFENAFNTFFYPGQTIVITGTASNNGTFTVKEVTSQVIFTVEFTFVEVFQTIVDETVVTTFSDIASLAHFYDAGRVDAKTFEKEIDVSEDCYTVLSKLLGKDCFVCEWAGAWWVMRVDEFNSYPIYQAHFDNRGAYIGISSGVSYDMSIGAAETRRFANADTLLSFIRPHGFAELDYPFDLPLEIPANVDFERGLLNNDVSPSEKHYDLDNWNELWSNTSTDDPATALIYIQRNFIKDSEVRRFVVIEADASGHLNFIMSEPIPVQALDKFDIDISQRLSSDLSGSGFVRIEAVQVRLYGDDGTYWTCHGGTSVAPAQLWVLSDITFRTSLQYFVIETDLSENFTEAHSLYATASAEIPVSGYLKILILANPEDPTAKSTYIDKLTFDYIAYINGSYRKYTKDSNRVDRVQLGYMAKVEEPVNIADGPNRLTKGAIQISTYFREIVADTIQFIEPNYILIPGNWSVQLYQGQVIQISGIGSNNQITVVSSVTYHLIPDNTEVQILGLIMTGETVSATISEAVLSLTRNWYSAQPLGLGVNLDPANLHSYGYIQIFSVWNQFRGADNADGDGEGINIFTGSVIGLGTSWPDLLYKFSLTDVNDQTMNRYFMVLSMSQDWRSCIWTVTLVEVYNTVAGRNYLDTYSFKYIAD